MCRFLLLVLWGTLSFCPQSAAGQGSTPLGIAEETFLPPYYSLLRHAPNAGNQLNLETSSGWASAYYGATILLAKQKNWLDRKFITHQSFSPVFNYSLATGSFDCAVYGGLSEVLHNMKTVGLVKFTELMAFCPQQLENSVVELAGQHKYFDYRDITFTGNTINQKIQSIKQSIYNDNPVVTEFRASPSFFTASEFWSPKEHFSEDFPLHSICIIGYDDVTHGGAFQIINSWGRNWGTEGHTWILYEELVEFGQSFYQLYIDEGKFSGVDVQLAGALELRSPEGLRVDLEPNAGEGGLKIRQPMKKNEEFSIHLELSQRLFFYLLHQDNTNTVSLVYPDEAWKNPQIGFKNTPIILPKPSEYYFLDTEGREEKLIFLFSKSTLEQTSLVKDLNSRSGTLMERLGAQFGSGLADSGKIQWSDDYSHFTVVEEGREVYPVSVAIQTR